MYKLYFNNKIHYYTSTVHKRIKENVHPIDVFKIYSISQYLQMNNIHYYKNKKINIEKFLVKIISGSFKVQKKFSSYCICKYSLRLLKSCLIKNIFL